MINMGFRLSFNSIMKAYMKKGFRDKFRMIIKTTPLYYVLLYNSVFSICKSGNWLNHADI